MLESIKLNNFTTYFNPTIIYFTATNYKILEDENVGSNRNLKGALFVGENASGKTQVLKSICFLLDMLFKNEKVTFDIYKSFYNNLPNFAIDYTFNVKNKKIVYKLVLGLTNTDVHNRIISEELTYDGNIIINRVGDNATFNFKEQSKHFEKLSANLLLLRTIYFDTHFYNDEFSSGLHNELERCLLKYFYHYSHDSQLFMTSHSTNILNTTILRPDQIYSVTFDPKDGSVLKRFSDQSPRESQNLEKMFLNGEFDGMPYYTTKF